MRILIGQVVIIAIYIMELPYQLYAIMPKSTIVI